MMSHFTPSLIRTVEFSHKMSFLFNRIIDTNYVQSFPRINNLISTLWKIPLMKNYVLGILDLSYKVLRSIKLKKMLKFQLMLLAFKKFTTRQVGPFRGLIFRLVQKNSSVNADNGIRTLDI